MAENTSWVSTTDAQRLGDELVEWFMEQAGKEARLVSPKAIEYGSRSMITQGRGLAEYGNKVFDINDQDAFELAVWDMVKLKVGRWTEAVMHGKPVSDDTLLDIGIYIKMAQRNREAGSWPGVQAAEPQKIVTEFNIVDGIPRVIPTEATQKLEDDDHHVHQINDAWRLEARGEIIVLKAYQWDLVRNSDNYTQHQFVQARNPVGGFHYVTSNPSPECTGYHAHDGYCLKPIPQGITPHPKLPETRKEETK